MSIQSPTIVTLLPEEYSALRGEIVKHTELRLQVIQVHLAFTGALLTVGLPQSTATILLVQPILAAFLANGWTESNISIFLIGAYIRTQIEPVSNAKWETDLHQLNRSSPLFRFRGLDFMPLLLFLFSQVGVFILASTKQAWTLIDNWLGLFSLLAILFTLALFIRNWLSVRSYTSDRPFPNIEKRKTEYKVT